MLGSRAEPRSSASNPTSTRRRNRAGRPCRALLANMAASRRAVLRGSGALGWALSWAATAATMSSRRRGSDAEAMGAACRFAEQAVAVEVWESARRVGCLRQRQ